VEKEQRMNERQRKMQQNSERFTPVRTSHFTLIEMTGYSFGARFIATFQKVDLLKKRGERERERQREREREKAGGFEALFNSHLRRSTTIFNP